MLPEAIIPLDFETDQIKNPGPLNTGIAILREGGMLPVNPELERLVGIGDLVWGMEVGAVMTETRLMNIDRETEGNLRLALGIMIDADRSRLKEVVAGTAQEPSRYLAEETRFLQDAEKIEGDFDLEQALRINADMTQWVEEAIVLFRATLKFLRQSRKEAYDYARSALPPKHFAFLKNLFVDRAVSQGEIAALGLISFDELSAMSADQIRAYIAKPSNIPAMSPADVGRDE